MKQLRSTAFLSFVIAIILQPSLLCGQSPAVTALQQRLMAPPGTVTLNVAELRLSKVNHADVRVEGGAIHLRLQNTIAKLDIDEVAHQGDALHVRKVEASFDKKNDTLRITVATDGGSFAPVAFVVGKDALATMDERALEGLIAPVLGVSGGAAPVVGNGATQQAPQAPPEAPMVAIPPPPPPPEDPKPTTILNSKYTIVGKELILDPAGPDMPPMHMPYTGMSIEKCRTGFYSPRYKIEIALRECEDDSSNNQKEVIEETDSGLVDTSSFYGTKQAPMMRFFTKSPAQTMDAAIKEQVIANLGDPAAKLGCQVMGPTTPAKGLVLYRIKAVGAYALKKTYPGTVNKPCGGFASQWEFLTRPSESKTRFVALFEQDELAMYDNTTLHFATEGESHPAIAPTGATASSSGDKAASAPKAQEKIPPMQDVWTSQGRMPGVDLADEASTVVSFTHGMAFDSRAGDAIIAVTCQKLGNGSGALVLHAEIPRYPNQQQVLANKIGTVMIGNGNKHDEQLATESGSRFLDISAPLNGADVAEMSANELVGARTLSLMYFGGAGRDIASGRLPAANAALDAVLNACHVSTPARAVMQPSKVLSPEEVHRLQLLKLKLGMSAADARQSLGAGFKYLPGTMTQTPRLTTLMASDGTSLYGMTFIDGALLGFGFEQRFAVGSKPLVRNLINSLTEKTWLPLSGGSADKTVWASNSDFVPIDLAAEHLHPNCRSVTWANSGAPNPFNFGIVALQDHGPDCGVAISLKISLDSDPSIAREMSLYMADFTAIHSIVSGVVQQQQKQKEAQRDKANQVTTPF